MYWVYVIRSKLNGQLYIGQTNNLRKRLDEHQQGKSQATQRYLPWELIYVEGYSSREDAVIRERTLKHFGRTYGQLKRRLKNSLS